MPDTLEIPSHIPTSRVVDVDIYNLPGMQEDVHGAWKKLQDGREMIWTPRNGGHWIATSGKLVEMLYRRDDLFSNRESVVPIGNRPIPVFPLEADGDVHSEFRAIIQPAFNPSELASYTVTARELAIRLIEGLKNEGKCEFIADFGLILPLTIFLSMMDLPAEDRHELHPHVEVIVRTGDPQVRQAAHHAIFTYITGWIEKRRAKPGNDLLTKIVQSKPFGRPATEAEIAGVGMLMLGGGLDTVASMMGFVMQFLATHPDHRKWLIANPGGVSKAIEEIMRRHGVGTNTRTVIDDMELGGVKVLAGEQISIPSCLYGLDEREFEDPMTVDFEREGKWSATFGAGPHRCPGMNLARMELRVLVEEWLARIPDFELDPEGQVIQASGGVNGVLRLPLRWQVEGNA